MPGNVGFNLDGANIVIPGTYVKNDTRAFAGGRPGPGGVILVAGTADGGDPSQVYEFGSSEDARRVVRGGDTLAMIYRMFRPSADQPGASLVRFVRVGAPTVGSVTAAGVVFTSEDKGRHVNGISVAIAAGTVGGTWDVTVRKRADAWVKTYTVGLGLSVTSTATTPKLVFDHVNREAKLYENGSVVGTFAYPNDGVTLAHLSSFINARSTWTSTVAGDPSMPVSYMDNPLLASAPAISASATSIPASQGALIWLLNTRDPQVTAALQTPGTFGPLSAVAETGLSGGTGTALDVVAASDFTTALAKLEAVDGQYLFLASTDPQVQALGNQHCIEMAKSARKRERIFVTGGPVGETDTQAKTRAAALDGPTCYVWGGTVITDPVSGLPKQFGGLGSAAQVVGMCGGMPDAEPLTNKTLLSEGVENPTVTERVLEGLLIAGVTPIVQTPRGVRMIQALTTYQSGPNPMFRKLQGLRIQYHLARGERAVLDDFVGGPMDMVEGQSLRMRMAVYLDSEIRSSRNPNGVLTRSSTDGKAWRNLTVVGDGVDLWEVDAEMNPVGESAYIKVTNHLSPARFSI